MRRVTTRACVLATLALAGLGAQAPVSPPSLAGDWPAVRLREVLIGRHEWKPVPAVTDRAAWEALSASLRGRMVRSGEKALASPIPALPATVFLEFARVGNRTRFEDLMFERRDRLHALVLAECVENRGRFLDAIVDTAWVIAEESSWTVPAHQGSQKAGVGLPDTNEPVVDLFAAQTAHSVAWTLYLLGDRLDTVSPLVRPRLAREVTRRVLDPFRAREDFGWMGFASRASRPNNWNPWINSNVIAAALLVEPEPGRRAELVHKALRSLDKFLGPHPRDGSCDEGPNYWGRAGASLFESLELLHSATAGRLDVFKDPVIADMGRFIYRARIAGTWFVNIGDSNPVVHVDRGLAFRYGRAIGDPLLQALGASGATEADLALGDRSIGRALFSVFGWADMVPRAVDPEPYPRDVWLPSEDMQLMAARDRAGTPDGWSVAAWAGHNDQSHNHNDVGNTIVFLDGSPVLIDVGRPTYTAKTFSSRRYEIWAMQSAFHNLPTIGGVMQSAGRSFAARAVEYVVSDAAAELRMDIAPAYAPEAGARSWLRSVRLNRGRDVVIADRFSLTTAVSDVRLTFMTPCAAREDGPDLLRLACGAQGAVTAALRFDGQALGASVERVALDDAPLTRSWGNHLNRIVLAARAPVQRAAWTTTVSR